MKLLYQYIIGFAPLQYDADKIVSAIKKEACKSGLLIRMLASPCRDRRPRRSVREKIDTQKTNRYPDRF